MKSEYITFFNTDKIIKKTEYYKALDIHENSKTRCGIHFAVELYLTKNASTRSGSNAIFDFSLNKVEF